jgi:VCBS repeat-containing protein
MPTPSLRAAFAVTLALATLGLAPQAVADQTQRDGDTAAAGRDVRYGPLDRPCNTRGNPVSGTITVTYVGSTHLTPGEGLNVAFTPPAGVTATAGAVTVPGDWDTNGQDFTIPILTTVSASAISSSVGFTVTGATSGYNVTPGGSQYGVVVDCATNSAPTGSADSYTTAEDTPKVVAAPGVLGNDTDPQSDALTAEKVTDPAHGGVVLAANGSFTYTPAADYNGPDSFTYKAKDGAGLYSGATTVSLTVTPVNDAPVALDDTASTDEEVAVDVDVLGNDSDADSPALTVTGASDGSHGTTTYDADSVVYTPAPDFFGTDSFTYSVSDGSGGTDSATVTVTVSNVNDAPVAADDSGSTDEDTPLSVGAAGGVLANDSDVDGDSLTASLASGPAHASSFSLDADGGYSYTPDANWYGTDSFTYRADDSVVTSGVATVTLTVAPVNDAPVADDEELTVAEDAFGSVDVLDGDNDVEGDALSVTGVTDGDHGTVVDNGDGTVTYTPAADFFGSDSFTYTVCDDHATTPASDPGCDTATVSVTVTAVNDAPVVTAGPDASASEGSAVSISATFADVDQAVGETYTASIAWGDGSTSTGTVTGNSISATHTYADDEAAPGDDVYQAVVTVTDSGTTNGAADPRSATATVPVTVSNVAPTVPAPSLSVNPFTGVLSLSTTFTDPAGSHDSYTGSFSVDGTTVAGTVSGMTLGATTELSPGCHTISATATVSDEDGGTTTSSAGSSGSGVDVYAVSFQAPIRDDARNVAKYGNVVPVKVLVTSSCSGLPVTTTPLSIQLVKGNVTNDVTVDDSNAAVTESVSNADSGTQMRVADGKYIYNLSTKGLTIGSDYTIRIRVGTSSTTGTIILRALLSTKK